LADHRASDEFSELERLALDYALALSDTPADVPDALFEALRAQLSEKQMVELTGVIAFENYLARFNRGFAIEAFGVSEGAMCPVPDHVAARMQSAS
jgi:4-carboxymuconolactone decarboxylase